MTEYGVKIRYQTSGAESAINSADKIVNKLDEILAQVSEVNEKMGNLGSAGEEGFDQLSQGASTSALEVSALVTIMDKLASAVSAVIQKVGEAVSQSVEYASALEESANVVEVSFGAQADQVKAWSKTTLDAFGLNEKTAMQYAGTMGAIFRSTGVAESAVADMSTTLVGLAGDIASFYNLSPESAFDKIRAGMIGQTRGLQELGIMMGVDELKAYALSKGLTTAYDKMSETDQMLVRYAYLLDVTSGAQGDYSRTAQGYANSLRTLQESWQELIGAIAGSEGAGGVTLLDRLADVIQRITRLLRSEAATEIIERIRDRLFRLLDVADRIITVVENIVDQWDKWGGIATTLGEGIVSLVGGLVAVAGAILAITAVMKVAKLVGEGINEVITLITAHPIIAAISAVIGVIMLVIKAVQMLTAESESFLGAVVGSAFAVVAFLINLVRGYVDFILDVVNYIVNSFVDLGNFFANVFRDPLGAAARLFADFAENVVNVIGGIAGIIDNVFGTHLEDSVKGWTKGLREWANSQGNGSYQQVIKRIDLNTSAIGWGRQSYADAYTMGVDLIDNKLLGKKSSSGGSSDSSSLYGNTDEVLDLISGISEDTGAIKSNTANSGEQLAALRELAEQTAANKIANITISAPVNATANLSGSDDIDGFINRFTEALSEGLNTSFTSSVTLFEEAF